MYFATNGHRGTTCKPAGARVVEHRAREVAGDAVAGESVERLRVQEHDAVGCEAVRGERRQLAVHVQLVAMRVGIVGDRDLVRASVSWLMPRVLAHPSDPVTRNSAARRIWSVKYAS